MEILLNLFTLNGLKVLWAAAAASAQKNPMGTPPVLLLFRWGVVPGTPGRGP